MCINIMTSYVGSETLAVVLYVEIYLLGYTSTLLATCLQTGFLLRLFFNPDDGGNMFHQNIS
jgi:hypothetical protein